MELIDWGAYACFSRCRTARLPESRLNEGMELDGSLEGQEEMLRMLSDISGRSSECRHASLSTRFGPEGCCVVAPLQA